VRPHRIGLDAAAAVALTGETLVDLGDHVVGQSDQVPVVDRDAIGSAARTPEAYGADGSITTSSISARNSTVCAASQLRTHAPDRPGASPSSTPGVPVSARVSASTNEVNQGSERRHPVGSSNQRTRRAAHVDAQHPDRRRCRQPSCGGGDQRIVRGVPADPVRGSDLGDRPIRSRDRSC
jgi:hypothetical protein